MTTLPSSLLMGWEPAGVRSRIDKRRKPSATPGAKNVSPMSGPRWTMRSIMLVSTCSLFSTSPVNPTNPHIGHLSFVWHSIKADKSLKSEFYRACAPSRESSLKRLMPPLFARARKKRRCVIAETTALATTEATGSGAIAETIRVGNRQSHEGSSQSKRTESQGAATRPAPGRRGVASAHNARAPCAAYDAARTPRRRTAPRASAHAKGQHGLAFQLSLSDSSRGF